MLKIVRSGAPLRGVVIGERKQSAMKAQELQYRCSLCKQTGTVYIPWDATRPERGDLIRKALHDHRVIGCKVRDAAARRNYEITYPRG